MLLSSRLLNPHSRGHFLSLFKFLIIFPASISPTLSFPSLLSSPPIHRYALTGQTCLPTAPSPPLPSLLLTSPPFSLPWSFSPAFFQASCHTTANSWNSCPPLASNRRLREGNQAVENKRKTRPGQISCSFLLFIIFLLKNQYCSSCVPVPGSLQVSSYRWFKNQNKHVLSAFGVCCCWTLRMESRCFAAHSPWIIPTDCQGKHSSDISHCFARIPAFLPP